PRDRPQPEADRPAVEGLESQNLQKEKVQGALDEVGGSAHIGLREESTEAVPECFLGFRGEPSYFFLPRKGQGEGPQRPTIFAPLIRLPPRGEDPDPPTHDERPGPADRRDGRARAGPAEELPPPAAARRLGGRRRAAGRLLRAGRGLPPDEADRAGRCLALSRGAQS